MRRIGKKLVALALAFTMSMPAGMMVSAKDVITPIALGDCVKSWNAKGKVEIDNIDALTDGSTEEQLSINRNDGSYYLAYAIYDAGEGKTFEFDTVEVSGSAVKIRILGSNNDDIVNINATDYTGDMTASSYALFCETFDATLIGDAIQTTSTTTTSLDFSGYRYLVVAFDYWETTKISEYSFGLAEKVADGNIGDVLDTELVTYSQGTGGTAPANNIVDFGVVKNATKNTLGLLGLADGDSLSIPAINAIDDTSDGEWKGYVQADVNADSSGTYRVSILGVSGNSRSYAVTVGDNTYTTNTDVHTSDAAVSTKSSGSSRVYYYYCDVVLEEGINRMTIKGNTGAPSFMMMAVTAVPTSSEVKVVDTDDTTAAVDVDYGKVLVCKSDTEVAWTIGGNVLAIGKTFRYTPTGDVAIEAQEATDDLKATGVVVGDVVNNVFTVTYGTDVAVDAIVGFTLVADGMKATTTDTVLTDYVGKTVEYTVYAGDRTIDYVVATLQ